MITQTIATWQTSTWKDELREAITDVRELLDLLGLGDSDLSHRVQHAPPFRLRVPRGFVARMTCGDPDDPLLRQVVPLTDELAPTPGFSGDPLAESAYNPVPGIIHKYRGRVLLITTPVCAINCRYCFRRHFPYGENTPGRKQWRASLAYIAADPSISEVILSGGDPLASDDRQLAWLVGEIEAIPHIRRLRIHSRLPVVIPSRIDEQCLAWLAATRLSLCMVLHINHPREIDPQVAAMVARLRDARIQVLNQAVLLAGVNDSVQTLADLSETLFAAGVLPYYLHLLDPVAGAGHFDTPEEEGRTLHLGLQHLLPGYLVPKLVRDTPGEPAKMLIFPEPPSPGRKILDKTL
jgi:EF-P beta-lysylation protein EpmB